MMQQLNNWLKSNHLSNFDSFINIIFKQNCLLCASPEANIHALCRACLNDLPWHPKTSCPQCGLASDGNICGSCISSPQDFDATFAVFLYGFPIDAMIQCYKYGTMLNISQTFGQLLSEKINLEAVDFIIPMPMHPTRLKDRGFNQAYEIAKILVRNQPEKLDYKIVIRQKLTPPQASLPLKQRVKNIKGAFSVTADLTGKRIAIVDDVMTTGASLNELAKTLKKSRRCSCRMLGNCTHAPT